MARAVVSLLLFSTILISSCGQALSESTYQGATVGALGGAAAGALIDKNNRWRGAVIGSTIGSIVAGSITDIAVRASREAASNNRPVEYRSEDGKQRVYSQPIETREKCTKTRTYYYKQGTLIKIEEKMICG